MNSYEIEFMEYDEEKRLFSALSSEIEFEPSDQLCLFVGPQNVIFNLYNTPTKDGEVVAYQYVSEGKTYELEVVAD